MSTPETPTERNARIFHEATARSEPVFVIRAQDRYAVLAIQAYADLLDNPDPQMIDALAARSLEVVAWQEANPTLIKYPDLRP